MVIDCHGTDDMKVYVELHVWNFAVLGVWKMSCHLLSAREKSTLRMKSGYEIPVLGYGM